MSVLSSLHLHFYPTALTTPSFHTHYARWSPLLLSACYLIAIRHTSPTLATSLAPKLYESSRSHISSALLTAPQPIEFFQASLILCLWSTTVGQTPLSIDGWLLSGFALQHSESSPLFHPSTPARALNHRFLWNHLCLAHLHYCVGTSRKPMLQETQITRCKSTITTDQTTNYETRMIAEIDLYWTVSTQLLNNNRGKINILESVTQLEEWKRQWRSVLDEPRSQFLQMGFHFSILLLLYNHTHSHSHSHSPSTPTLTHHAKSIIQTAITTEDARTRHLTDHIYHMITFAGIVICRILHTHHHHHHHQPEIPGPYETSELEALIVR
ncbi:hypothetical protein ASPCADRAFT_210942, partial [Aspergillus carbonarius ITEM 5010]